MKKILFGATLVILLGSGLTILAQETTGPQIVKAQDLGVSDPKVLPDSPIYFLKDWVRSIRSFITTDPVKKAELHEQFLNEKLIELQKMVEKGKDKEKTDKATTIVQQEMETLKTAVGKIKETAETSPEVNKFLDKFTEQGLLQQKILEKLVNQVPTEVMTKIEEARQEHLQKFGEVMEKLETTTKIADRIKEALNAQPDYQLKPLEDLQTLKNIASQLPQVVQETLKIVEAQKLQDLKQRVENMSTEQKAQFEQYFQQKNVNKETQLEVIESLKSEFLKKVSLDSSLKNLLDKTRETIIHGIQESSTTQNCPNWMPPIPGFCKEGRIVIPEDPQTGCKLAAKCVIPQDESNAQSLACTTLWDPVCGSDNKTYSNECFAKAADASVIYKGECQDTNIEPPIPALPPTSNTNCKNLWFFDNNQRTCQQKNFCGVYMYLGLYTFETKEACEKSLSSIPGEYCDANIPCPEGKECYAFENEEKPTCWKGDPCEKCESKKCAVLESYPPQVRCQ
jgi:hypothetical protein